MHIICAGGDATDFKTDYNIVSEDGVTFLIKVRRVRPSSRENTRA